MAERAKVLSGTGGKNGFKDMILVMENYKGTERNMLMTLEDYKKFVAIDDMSELADQMLLLGRTLAEGFTEYYRAANVTVLQNSVEMMWNWDAFCKDIIMIQRNFTLIRQQVPQSVLQRWMRLE